MQRGVLPLPLLYLSAFFEATRRDYYDGLRAVQQRGELHDRRNFSATGGEERAVSVRTKAERTDARGVVESEHVVEILIRFPIEDVFSHRTLDQHSAPAIGSTVLHRAEKRRAVVWPGGQRKRGGVDGECTRRPEPLGGIFTRHGRAPLRSVKTSYKMCRALPLV